MLMDSHHRSLLKELTFHPHLCSQTMIFWTPIQVLQQHYLSLQYPNIDEKNKYN